MGRNNDVPLALENRMELDLPSVAVVSVVDFVIKYNITVLHGRQFFDVNALLLHREVLCLRVVPDGQVSLALLQRVSYGLHRQFLLAHVRDASLRVSATNKCIVFSFFFSVLPLSIGNDVDAVLDILSCSVFGRFYESQFDIVIKELLVRNAVAGRSKQDLIEFRSLVTIK